MFLLAFGVFGCLFLLLLLVCFLFCVVDVSVLFMFFLVCVVFFCNWCFVFKRNDIL